MQSAARRVAAVVDDARVTVSVGPALQLERGGCLRVDGHGADIDAVRNQLGDGVLPEGVVADPAQPADPVAEPGESDGDVHFRAGQGTAVAGHGFQPSGLLCDEHGHHLAERDDIEVGGLGAHWGISFMESMELPGLRRPVC